MLADQSHRAAALTRGPYRAYLALRPGGIPAIRHLPPGDGGRDRHQLRLWIPPRRRAAGPGRDRGVAGYDAAQLATFVWVGQGLIGVVLLWAPTELADRIRTGDVITDLLRPIDPVWRELAGDLGRAGFAVLTRFVGPIVVGALAYDLLRSRATGHLRAVRLLDAARHRHLLRLPVSRERRGLLAPRRPGPPGGLDAPVGRARRPLLSPLVPPRAAALAIVIATPFPSVIQLPLDILVERGSALEQVGHAGRAGGLGGGHPGAVSRVQRRAERRLVVQGG